MRAIMFRLYHETLLARTSVYKILTWGLAAARDLQALEVDQMEDVT